MKHLARLGIRPARLWLFAAALLLFLLSGVLPAAAQTITPEIYSRLRPW